MMAPMASKSTLIAATDMPAACALVRFFEELLSAATAGTGVELAVSDADSKESELLSVLAIGMLFEWLGVADVCSVGVGCEGEATVVGPVSLRDADGGLAKIVAVAGNVSVL